MAAARVLVAGLLLFAPVLLHAQEELQQEVAVSLEQQEAADEQTEDDAQWQQLHAYTRHQLNLNKVDELSLQALGLLTPLEVTAFMRYRSLYGPLLSIYELQAVPGWDLATVRRLLPFVKVSDGVEGAPLLVDYHRRGQHTVLLRHTHRLHTTDDYLGSPDKLMFRYRYSFPGYASSGVTAEKDAGEQFLKGAQRKGFDFYSAHLYIARWRRVQALALGDYVVNLGQGLIQWHSMALGKGAAVMQVKREGEVLRPYTSAGEYYFFRGAGTTLTHKRWSVTGFASMRKLDAGGDGQGITSLISSGYHRDSNEVSKIGRVRQMSYGGCIQYSIKGGRVGLNVIGHRLSAPLLPETTLYGKFAVTGSETLNASIDYSKGVRNLHFFGELARDRKGRWAMLQGLLASLSAGVDASLIYRQYDRAYQSMYPNAFAANTKPVNETGLYIGLLLRPRPGWELAAYTDIYRHPWLKFRVNAPSSGMDALVMATWRPSKVVETVVRYTWKEQMLNESGGAGLPYVGLVRTSNLRWHTELKTVSNVLLRTRIEMNQRERESAVGRGWLFYQELQTRIPGTPLRVSGRLTRFDVSGEGNGLYASENGMLYDYAMSRFSGIGWQWYLNMQYKLSKSVTCWFRVHRTREQAAAEPMLLQWQVIAHW
ncbi:helix-hairpin-helix domain-containing protein [Chitinophaga horti]|uniref:Helix-hairpin-helix domain-containing protein n=1 Tax=Chitinophaga horti TaxID=2920382 RepID=A0ABY6J0F8_9BACT|nr:helix-hairpin-helix domain-containing protein [Chitinophaga horti]UYQ91856.1 helix-hairpin-helix domain-containing protein [Chitinophaga horti]